MHLPTLLLTASIFSPPPTFAIGPHRAIDVLRRRGEFAETSNAAGEAADDLRDSRDGGGLGLGLDVGDVDERFLEQRLDQFSSRPCPNSGGGGGGSCETETFRQRYFYSSRFVDRAEGGAGEGEEDPTAALRGGAGGDAGDKKRRRRTYAFLCVGGEGSSLDKSVLVDSAHCSGDMLYSAQKLHEERGADVHLFALEHRYYGESYPVFRDEDGKEESPVLNENLVYLSSRQALADLAHFVSDANSRPDLFPRGDDGEEADVKWATFGGSYPGMLSAWSRLKFPHLIRLSVSNSAPIQPEINFTGYNDRVARDLSYERIGGSDDCRATFEEGHQQVADALRSGNDEDRAHVARLFNVCGGADSLVDRRNADMFVGDGLVFPPAQSNDPHCAGDICDIGRLCSRLLQEKKEATAMDALAAVAKIQNEGESCTEVDWNKTLSYLSSPAARAGGLRSWLWQTCTEFGFYQTCEVNSTCPYGRGFHGLDADLEICSAAFGVPPASVRQNVRDSLDYFGGWDVRGVGKLLSVNGDVDPWSELALTPERQRVKSGGRPTVWVKGASHHFWTHSVKVTDDADVRAARENIYGQVKAWLGEEGYRGKVLLDESGKEDAPFAPIIQ